MPENVKKVVNYPTGTAKWIIIFTAIACAVLELIDSTIVTVSLREISGNIGATITEISWVTTAYSIANVVIIPLSGMLSNLFGRKRYFTASVAAFTFASLMCGLSTGLWGLVFWRFVQGLAGGGLLSTAGSIVIGAFPPEQARTGFTYFAMGLMLGPILGPFLGGYITDQLSWHWIFFINLPIGILAANLSWNFIPDLEGAKKPNKIDWSGIFLIAIALGSLVYVLEEGNIHDWFESQEITLFFFVSIITFLLFIWRELTTDEPAVNLKLYRNVSLGLGNIISFVVSMMLMGTQYIFPLLTQISLGWTATQTGTFLITGGIAGAISMRYSKLLFPKATTKQMMLGGMILVIIALMLLSLSSPDSNQDTLFWAYIIRSIGAAVIIPQMTALAVGDLRGKELAQATGLSTMFRQLGAAIGVAIVAIYTTNNNALVRANIIGNLSAYNSNVTERLNILIQQFLNAGFSLDKSETAAYLSLDNNLIRQQIIMSYNHGFMLFALLVLCCIPIVLCIKSRKKEKVK